MSQMTLNQSQRSCFDTEDTRRNRQECIRKSWSPSERNRRRETATAQQLRLIEMLQGRTQRTAC